MARFSDVKLEVFGAITSSAKVHSDFESCRMVRIAEWVLGAGHDHGRVAQASAARVVVSCKQQRLPQQSAKCGVTILSYRWR